MNNNEILSILSKYALTKKQIQELEKFNKEQLNSFLSLISNSEIKYIDTAINIIKKDKTMDQKQLSVLNKARTEEISSAFASFLADNKCALSEDSKIRLIDYANNVKNAYIGLAAVKIVWQLAEAGATRTNEDKYVELGSIMSNFSRVEDLTYVKDFLYTLYPKACYRQTIDEEVLENENIERDVISLMAKCPVEKMPYVHKMLSSFMTGTIITPANYKRFIDTLEKAISLRNTKILELAGDSAPLFTVIKENRQLDYVNAILDYNSTYAAKAAVKLLKKATSYLNDTVYETPELLNLIRTIGLFDSSDVYRWFGNRLENDINSNNIPAALYIVKHKVNPISDVNLVNQVLSILNDKEDYVLFDELYEDDKDAAILSLRKLAETFPGMQFSAEKTYVKKYPSTNIANGE